MDVDTCKIKGFENAIQYDYLKDDKQPQWKYKGRFLPIEEIAKLEGRKLMIVMNPPYQRRKGLKYDMAEIYTGFSDGNNKKEKAK